MYAVLHSEVAGTRGEGNSARKPYLKRIAGIAH
jgi:hypothetical protein